MGAPGPGQRLQASMRDPEVKRLLTAASTGDARPVTACSATGAPGCRSNDLGSGCFSGVGVKPTTIVLVLIYGVGTSHKSGKARPLDEHIFEITSTGQMWSVAFPKQIELREERYPLVHHLGEEVHIFHMSRDFFWLAA